MSERSHDRKKKAARRGQRSGGRVQRSEPSHPVLELQRQLGNSAVTRLVQRTPKDRPASTDAPGKKPKKRKAPPAKKLPDIHARVVKADIDEGKTRITIAASTDQGVQVGMAGSLISDKGREIADFTINKVEGNACTAYVDAILDQVRANPQVIIKASKFVPDSQEGREF